MATKNDDVVGLAKKTAAKKPAAKRKPAAKKPAPKKPTAKEVRDQKAKETVKELLEDSPIVTLNPKEDELLVLDEPTQEPKGVEWLEEQVGLLTQKNEALSAELETAKIRNQELLNTPAGSDAQLKKVVIQLFNELQENYIKMGIDNRGMGNFRIYTPGFLNRLVKFFPFLEEVKRY